MCPPVIAAIGVIASVAGSVVSGIGAVNQANAQAAQANAQAQLQERQAGLELQAGQQDARRKQEEARRMIGQQIGQYAGSGVTLEGSPTDIVMDTQRETFLDQQAILLNSEMKADNRRYEAQISRMNAKGFKQAGTLAAVGAGINAVQGAVKGAQLLSKF